MNVLVCSVSYALDSVLVAEEFFISRTACVPILAPGTAMSNLARVVLEAV